MPKRRAKGQGTKNQRQPFTGFERPTSNWFRMPNTWTDITADIKSLAELKVVEYILRHTWGYQEYGLKKHITVDEFVNGRKRHDGTRMDKGTGLSRRAVQYALAKASEDGLIEEDIDASDRARVKKYYSLRMKETTIEESEARLGVQTLRPGVQTLRSRGAKSSPRTEKDTIERNIVENVVVIEALQNFRISRRVAQHIAQNYPEDYILEKLDLAQWLVEIGSSLISRNPAGYLRRAIEDDYTPPGVYKTKAQREAEEQERQGQLEERKRLEEEALRAKQALIGRLKDQHQAQAIAGSKMNTAQVWQKALEYIEEQVSTTNFNVWFQNTLLLEVTDGEALIGAPSGFVRDCLQTRFSQLIARAIWEVLETEIEPRFEALSVPIEEAK